MYLTEFLGEDPDKWSANDIVMIGTPPGSGKTTFAHDYAIKQALKGKKVAFLSSRSILKEQMEAEHFSYIAKNDVGKEKALKNIRFMTYQTIEECIKNGGFWYTFDVIISDEAHYFISDSIFNVDTILSIDWLMSQRNTLLIFMSGTIGKIRNYIFENYELKSLNEQIIGKMQVTAGRYRICHEYEMAPDYSNYDVKYLSDDCELVEILKEDKMTSKAIIFTANKDRGERLKKQLNSDKISAESVNASNKNSTTKNTVSNLSDLSMFKEQILITTSVLDVGVSIHDEKICYIAVEAYDKDTFRQMLARLRVKKDRQITLLIYQQNLELFQKWLGRIKDKLKVVKKLIAVPEDKLAENLAKMTFDQEFDQENVKSVINESTGLRLNKLACTQLLSLYGEYKEILEGLKEDPDFFLLKQLEWIGKKDEFDVDNFVAKEIKQKRRNALIELIDEEIATLDDSVGKNELQEVFIRLHGSVRALDREYIRSNENLSIKKFRQICKVEELPFRVEQFTDKKTRRERYKIVRTDTA